MCLKRTPFELHHGRKPTTELPNIVEDGTHIYRIDQKHLFQHQPNKLKVPIYVGSDADGEITNHVVLARTKMKKKQASEGLKSPQKKAWLEMLLNL